MHSPLTKLETARLLIAEKIQELAAATSIREAKDIHTWARMVKAAAKEHGDCEEIVGLAAELQMRSEIRLGQFQSMMPKNRGTRGQLQGDVPVGGSAPEPPTDETPTLKELGISKSKSSRWQKLAGLSKEEQEAHIAEIKQRTVRSTEYSPDRSNDDEWFTPVEIMEAVRDVLGTIDLDPASCAEAQQTVQATRYFTAENDGLKQEWAGRVWLNPPFSHPLNIHFVNKLIAEVASGRVSEAILLVNILPSAWLQDALEACSAVCFSRDRLRFTHQTGKVQNNRHNLGIFFFGSDVEKFQRRFTEFGLVLLPNLRLDSAPVKDKASHGDEWFTPSEYVEVVRALFGGVIDLDPASCEEAQQTVQAKRYYTKDDDGLKQPWSGRVFLNPPYSNPTLFVNKLIQYHECGDVPEAILLGNTDSSARWFHKALRACSALCFPSSSIKFRHGLEVCSPRYSSLFFYFGDDVERFRQLFASLGTVVPVRTTRDNPDHSRMTVLVEWNGQLLS